MTRKARDHGSIAWGVVLAILLLLAMLFAPAEGISDDVPHLSTFSRERNGAAGLYETAGRLGWNVTRNVQADLPPARTDQVYAVLDPRIPPTAREVHELLERVRAGAALVTVVQPRTPLADSLSVRRGRIGPVPADTTAECPSERRPRIAESLRGDVWVSSVEGRPFRRSNREVFLDLAGDRMVPTAALAGFPLGAGRVGVVSDPALLTNAVLRRCRLDAGVGAVALLRWISSDRDGLLTRRTMIFDEYRHGFGTHPSVGRVAVRFMREHPVGRTLLHATLGGLVLIAAVAARPGSVPPPRSRPRRSPLEHVRALALAYARVGASRTATRLLVRGLRRRHGRAGIRPPGGDAEQHFLAEVRARFPALSPDMDRVERALLARVSSEEFVAVGHSIAQIERTIASANQ